MHKWEKLIYETSINTSTVNLDTRELYLNIDLDTDNSFITHYKIASVEKKDFIFDDSSQLKKEYKDYKLLYNKKGQLIQVDEVSCIHSYFYDKKGQIDSTATLVYSMGNGDMKSGLVGVKEIKTWDRVKGKTGRLRLVEREIYSPGFPKREKTKLTLLSKIKYSYFRDGLLSEINTFDEKGKLKSKSIYTYTFH